MSDTNEITRLVFDRVKKQLDGPASVTIEVHRGDNVTLRDFPITSIPLSEHQIRTIATPSINAALTGESSEPLPEIEWPSYWPV